MRTFTFAVLSLAAVASAANIGRRQSQPPACATRCLNTGTNNVPTGSCDPANFACLCSSVEYVQGVINCLATDCADHQDLLTSIQYSAGFCGVAGVNSQLPVTTPTAQLTPTSTGSHSTSSSGTSSASSSSSSGSSGAAMNKATLSGATLGALALAAVGLAF
ncbi:SubName: Full=Uncharacterized protein {ECO:0000313/EMBL:CCA76813.1} [Serendipita indica DSM 11827]|nr:SubName: Full=Uncharacterized protein {ECO:0000313/EMBL:CCA76813.1} [Serendipita indica DSM 11827]